MTLFKNKYRIESTRLEGWDYTSNGLYFVTICIHKRHCFFGDVVSGEMQLSTEGKLAQKFWREIPNHFSDFHLDEFIVMPNHIHGILVIDHRGNAVNVCRDAINLCRDGINLCRDAINRVSTEDIGNTGGVTKQHNPMLSKDSLSKVIRWYKGRTKFEIGKINLDFSWQPRFDERIIRDQQSLQSIRHYIAYNPQQWQDNSDSTTYLASEECKKKI
ncbi:MAG: hypothetical protein DSM106950_32075 [Stigonema ocellatum SAG 48.90 = DSM 106950]|nr:hypothetical protein [Stigonema ocellatum SAG 48.90 = DSM 106950]